MDIVKMCQNEIDKKERIRNIRKWLENERKFTRKAAKQFIKDNPNYSYNLGDEYEIYRDREECGTVYI